MPFSQFTPRSLTVGSVRANAPAASGIYGLSNRREWVYIGQTDNIQAALLDHLQTPTSLAMQQAPTGFVFELCDLPGRQSRQDRLVFEYGPVCNRT